ncbi:hypothetical protein Tco_0987293, partial [Tanacetum coccineum]
MDDYAALVAHPTTFQKFPEPFLCLVGMIRYYTLDKDTYLRFLPDDREGRWTLSAFIHIVDPTKLKIVERERVVGKKRLLDSTVGRVVPILPIALACTEGNLEASVDKLFDEGSSTDQGDSAAGAGHDVEIELVTDVEDIAAANKLRGGHGTSSGVTTGGKSLSVLKELLASSILSPEVGFTAMATLPFITSSISATTEHEGGDSVTGPNIPEVDSIITSDVLPPVMTETVVTSHAVSAPSILIPEMETKITSPIHASIFHDFGSMARPNVAGPSYSAKQDLSMGSRELNTETLHQVFVPQWNVLNDSLLDDSDVSQEFVDHLAPPALLEMVSVVEAAEKVRVGEMDALKQKNVALKNEKDSLNGKITDLQSSVSAKDLELKDLNVVVSSLKSQNDGLVDQVHTLEATCSSLRDQLSHYELLKEQIEAFQDAQMKVLDDKVAKLDADLLEMALHLEEKLYPYLLTTISGQRWLLTCGLKLNVVKCLNSLEYLTALGSAISRAIENGMQSGLSAGIDHRKAGRSLEDVVAYNPADASVTDIMNPLRLESPLVDAPRMSDLQPDVEQLMLPIHQSEDQVVLGETSLSFALSVAHSQVEKIRGNVAEQRSALVDVWVPLVEPLSAKNFMGVAGTSDSVPTIIATTTVLSTTFASTSSVPPITIDDYKVVSADGQEDAQGNIQGNVQENVASFPTVEYEKEKLSLSCYGVAWFFSRYCHIPRP